MIILALQKCITDQSSQMIDSKNKLKCINLLLLKLVLNILCKPTLLYLSSNKNKLPN